MENKPQYYVIEKDNEVVFYVPYDKELVKLYTKEFFSLHDQDADVAIIAFHNNDDVLLGGYTEDDDIYIPPYEMFRKRAEHVEGKLRERFRNIPQNESPYNLFSNLLENARYAIPIQYREHEDRELEPESINTLDVQNESVAPAYNDEQESIEPKVDYEYESVKEPVEQISKEITPGNIFQITIQKKIIADENQKRKLKIPLDVKLEKEIDYYHEKLPNREITEKYALHGIYMLV